MLTSLSIALFAIFAIGEGEPSIPLSGKQSTAGSRSQRRRRLKSLEDENRRLKKLLAESMLDNAALKDLLGKNV